MGEGRGDQLSEADQQDLAELYLGLKGKKQKRLDWISLARVCRRMVNRYGDSGKLARQLGVSEHLIKTISSLLDLPKDVQALVRKRAILYDAAYRLHTLADRGRISYVATMIQGLTSHQQREIIQFAKAHPGADLGEFRDRVVKPKQVHEKLHLMLVPLDDITFRSIKARANSQGKSVQDTILAAIWASLKKREHS